MKNNQNKLSFKKAAKKILEELQEPLTAKEITNLSFEKEIIETEGKTPAATMAAILYTDLKKKDSIFKKVGRGKFALKTQKQTASSPLLLIEQQNQLVSKKLKEKLQSMDPFQFEVLVGDLLQNIGYENVEVTKRSGDKGIDVKANLTVGGLTNVKTVIQAKRYKDKNKISGKTITQLRGSAEVDQRGLVITTSSFTKDAIEESRAQNKMPVALVDGKKLIELMFKFQVGIKKEELPIYSLDTEYFDNETGALQNSKLDSTEKNRSIWPLPGGTLNYIETLDKFLKVVETNNYDRNDLINWFLSEFDTVSSENTASGYINVPKNMGLIESVNKVFKLTEAGTEYLKNKDYSFLYSTISKNIIAFDDIYEFLENSDESQTEQNVLDYVKENFDIQWSTFAQINFRLMWLINLGMVEKDENGFRTKK